jgi:hypothetical protein
VTTHKLAITQLDPTGYSVTVDGHDISTALTGLSVTMNAGRHTEATLDLRYIDVTEIQDAETRIHIPDAIREVLLALGWTAPAEDEPTPPACQRCKGRGVVPDWTNWDAYHGEPKPKPCPDCTTED